MSGRHIFRFKDKAKRSTGRQEDEERQEVSFRKPSFAFNRSCRGSFRRHDLRETLTKRYQANSNDGGRSNVTRPVEAKNSPVDLIKLAMSKLYNLETRVMNLESFHKAEEFTKQGIFIAMNRAKELRNVVNIIVQNCPDLVALSLCNNRLNLLDPLQSLENKCSFLKTLDLSRNNIISFNQIKHISKLDLFELVLKDNPFVDDFPTQACYAKAVQKIFKNLRKLDNEDLPIEIGFDLGVQVDLLQSKDSSIPPECKQFVLEFLEAYYRLYDSTDSRRALIQAYHDKAIFSFSYSKHDYALGYDKQLACFSDSHNLARIHYESDKWVECVKTFGLEIVSFLCKFPTTEHDPSSFKIDVPFYENNLIVVVVNGIFKEINKEKQPKRSFCRNFYITPHGQGYVIVNDMLTISSLSEYQSMKNKKVIFN